MSKDAQHPTARSDTRERSDTHTRSDIEITNLIKTYGKPGSPQYVRALDGLNLHIPAGQIVGLMGENGSGKSTLLKILAGALLDYEGDVLIGGERPGVHTKALSSFLPDSSALPAKLTAIQAARMYSDFFSDFDQEKAMEKLRYFGVPSDRPCSSLSKGQREKMQIAMTMARNAQFFFLDEPISGIDPAAREQILGGILTDLPEDATLIVSTHLIHDIEPIVSHAVFMHAGKVLLSGEADALREEHGQSLDGMFRRMYQWK